MKTVIIVQARMGSYRFPGKVMKRIAGIPTIGIILKRLQKTREANQIIVAISNNKKDKILLKYLFLLPSKTCRYIVYYLSPTLCNL